MEGHCVAALLLLIPHTVDVLIEVGSNVHIFSHGCRNKYAILLYLKIALCNYFTLLKHTFSPLLPSTECGTFVAYWRTVNYT